MSNLAESEWALDAVLQFTRSPLWVGPVNNFIDDHCMCFDTSDTEMKLAYTEIHQQFQLLIDKLLTDYVNEIGVSCEVIVELCRQRVTTQQHIHSSNSVESAKRFLEYLTYLDDFRSFKKMMEKRNVELDFEAMKQLQARSSQSHAPTVSLATAPDPSAHQAVPNMPPPPTAQPTSPGTEDSGLMEKILRESIAEAELARKQAELEDAEIQQALALSVAEEEARVERERQALRDAQHQAEHQAQHQAQLQAVEEQHRQTVAAMERDTLQQRAQKIITVEQELQRKQQISQLVASTTAVATHQPPPPITQPPPPTHQPPPPTTQAPPPTTQASVHHPPEMELAPLGRRAPSFGKYKPLPSIQPSFRELSETVSPTVMHHSSGATQQPQQATSSPAAFGQPQSLEDFEKRQKEIKAQRDLIIAQRKELRRAEMKELPSQSTATTGTVPPPPPPTSASGHQDDAHKQLTLDIGRRFRDDIVHEVRKQHSQQQKE